VTKQLSLRESGYQLQGQPGLSRFAGPRATAQSVGVPVLVFLSLNSAPAGLTQTSDIRLTQIQILFFALVCSWAYFTASGVAINKVAPAESRRRSILIAVLFMSTEVLRTVLVHEFALMSGLESDPVWLFRISGGATTGLIFFSILSVVVNDSEYYRQGYRKLFEQRLRLSAALQSSESTLAATRSQLISGVREQLASALRSVLKETQRNQPKTAAISEELFRVSEEVVRPLSHELFDIPVVIKESNMSIRAPRMPFVQVVADTTLAEPFRPNQLVLIGFLITIPLTFLFTQLADWVTWPISLVLTYLILWLARNYLTAPIRRLPFALRGLVISLVYVLPAYYFSITLMTSVNDESSNPFINFLYGYALLLVLGWLLAATSGMRLSRERMLDEVQEVNNQLYRLGVRLQAELWVDQKNLALTLHNDVQASLLAAALKLKASAESGDVSPEVLNEVKGLISRGMNFAADETVSKTLDEAVSRLNQNWGGLITMKYTASEESLDALARDSVSRGVLEDILSEFQNNSLKHGKATETTAIITLPEPHVLQVAMTNNGQKIHNFEVASGLGSAFLSAVSLSHHLENFTRGVKLTVKLPLQQELPNNQS
jgi:signal transduction histidine kinase